jgi:hypothetical protein
MFEFSSPFAADIRKTTFVWQYTYYIPWRKQGKGLIHVMSHNSNTEIGLTYHAILAVILPE